MAQSSDATVIDLNLMQQPQVEIRKTNDSHSSIGGNEEQLVMRQEGPDPADIGQTGASLEGPSFQVSREGARKIAALTSDEEYQSLLEQHAALIKKEIEGDLSKNEKLHLKLIIWILDCVEVAKFSPGLDALETIVRTQAQIAGKITSTVDELESIIATQSAKQRYPKVA